MLRSPASNSRPLVCSGLLVFARVFLSLALFTSVAAKTAPLVEPRHPAFHTDESIVIQFSGGPGNAKDWIGLFPAGMSPEEVGIPELWLYVDGTDAGVSGISEGFLTFQGGFPNPGVWTVYFLRDDSFEVLATNQVVVVDRSQPILRTAQDSYMAHTAITISFAGAPGNPKDWIGIYAQGQTPGQDAPVARLYLDGTETGDEARVDGGVTFFAGVRQPGNYEARLFRDDTFEALASVAFEVTPGEEVPPALGPVSPAEGASNLPPVLEFSAVFTNGTSFIVPASVSLTLDGTEAPAEVVASDNRVTVTYRDPNLPASGPHTWRLTAVDDATPPNTFEVIRNVSVGIYQDLQIPEPLYFLDFDSVPEGSLPDGWTEESHSAPLISGVNFQALSSVVYGKWTAVDADRFKDLFSIYDETDNLIGDYIRVLSVNRFNVVNGKVYDEPLPRGRFLFANSGFQNRNASQVLYLFSPDFDLSGKTGVYLGFKSVWEQNENSMAAIEYSIDGGASWKPVAYYLESSDIVRVIDETHGGFRVDAIATMNRRHNDIASYIDNSGVEVGGTYGAFIGAPVSNALETHIFSRIDDDPIGSKRIEYFRLPDADNQPAVRFRFTHAGRDSWYFGIDDFGLYATDSGPGEPPKLSVARQGDEIVLTWPANAEGFTLESASALGGDWNAVPGVSGNSHTIPAGATQEFFRLRR